MNLLISMLPLLLTAMLFLMTGILLTREPKQSKKSALIESAIWGCGFLIAFSVEMLAFPTL